MRVGLVGIGVMGSRMAWCLIEAGHEITVNDTRRDAAANLLEVGASWADRPSAVAEVSEEAKKRGGLSAFREARDNPFRPEPFGPRSK